MKKSILITGKKGSGKTTKIKEILSSLDQSKYIEMSFENFQLSIKSDLKNKFDIILLDEIYSSEQIKYLSAAIITFNFILIVATQICVNELETSVLSNFDVVECSVF